METDEIGRLATKCEDAALERVADYFADKRSPAQPGTTVLGQADLLLQVGRQLRQLADERASR